MRVEKTIADQKMQITKRGSTLGRTALVQCAFIAQRYSPYLKRYCENVRGAEERPRRLLCRCEAAEDHLSNAEQNRLVFEDLPNFVLAEAS